MQPSPPSLEEVLRDFDEHRRWPKDVADFVASCRPSDEILLELMRRESVRHQSLALHVIAQRIADEQAAAPGLSVAKEVLRLLETEAFMPKGRYLRDLKAWAQGIYGDI